MLALRTSAHYHLVTLAAPCTHDHVVFGINFTTPAGRSFNTQYAYWPTHACLFKTHPIVTTNQVQEPSIYYRSSGSTSFGIIQNATSPSPRESNPRASRDSSICSRNSKRTYLYQFAQRVFSSQIIHLTKSNSPVWASLHLSTNGGQDCLLRRPNSFPLSSRPHTSSPSSLLYIAVSI